MMKSLFDGIDTDLANLSSRYRAQNGKNITPFQGRFLMTCFTGLGVSRCLLLTQAADAPKKRLTCMEDPMLIESSNIDFYLEKLLPGKLPGL